VEPEAEVGLIVCSMHTVMALHDAVCHLTCTSECMCGGLRVDGCLLTAPPPPCCKGTQMKINCCSRVASLLFATGAASGNVPALSPGGAQVVAGAGLTARKRPDWWKHYLRFGWWVLKYLKVRSRISADGEQWWEPCENGGRSQDWAGEPHQVDALLRCYAALSRTARTHSKQGTC
jgi:hypothetical protein